MNRPIRVIAIATLVMFLALLLNVTYVQYWQANSLNSLSKHPDNARVRDAEFSRERGSIFVGRDTVLAESVKTDDQYAFQRRYPNAFEYAGLTGYFSRDLGIGGVEATQNSILGGSDPKLFVNRVIDLAGSRTPRGGNVKLTINPAAQKAAYQGILKLGKDTQAAVVALEPGTGRVLAMVSNPTFDPNVLASHDFSKANAAKERLLSAKPSPLDNAAIETVLPPGSTFKLVTAAAALESGNYTPNSKVPGGRSLDLPQTKTNLVNENGMSCGGDQITLTRALAVSCNVAFGSIGLKLGGDALREQAERFGFDQVYFSDLDDALNRQAKSRFPANPDPPQTALSAIGQFDVAATPLQMAMVTASIANGGTTMKPNLIDQVLDSKLDVLDKLQPESLPGQPAMSVAHARQLTEMMEAVVTSGTGRTAQIPGVRVAGKTGTAQSAPNRPPYAWFVSFAPADNPRVAVAVLVQDAGVDRDQISGSGLAAPIAKSVMEAVLGR